MNRCATRKALTALTLLLTASFFVLGAAAEPVSSPSPAPGAAAASPNDSPSAQTDDRIPFLAEDRKEQAEPPPSGVWLLLRTLGALFLIVGVIAVAAWGLRRYGGTRFGAPRADAPELAVLASVSLGDRRSLSVIRFGDRTLLLGATAQSITLLATEDSSVAVASRPARSVAEMLDAEAPASFAQELSLASQRADQPSARWPKAEESV
jgi:flagellar biosynthetic protein FliO